MQSSFPRSLINIYLCSQRVSAKLRIVYSVHGVVQTIADLNVPVCGPLTALNEDSNKRQASDADK